MLDSDTQSQLAVYLEKLCGPVVLSLSTDQSQAGADMRAFVEQLCQLSPLLSWHPEPEAEGHPRPSFGIRSATESQARVRFGGVPLGHEFGSLVLALLQLSGYAPKVAAETLAVAAALEGDYHFESFISLTCQSCPEVVQALNLMAVVNPRIRHTAFDGAVFEQQVEQRQVMAVPTVFLNGKLLFQGRLEFEEILAKLDSAAVQQRQSAQLAAAPVFDVLVVGGGPAGAAAAVYAARKGIVTGIVAERLGGQLLDTLGIENFISVDYTEGPALARNLEAQLHSYGVQLLTGHQVQALRAEGSLWALDVASGGVLRAKTVVLASGARWRQMGVPGEETYRNHGVAYCPHCDGPLFKNKPVAVIGGGNSGVEAAIDLAGICSHVTLLEFADQLRADQVLQDKLASLANVRVITQAQSTEVLGDGHKVQALTYTDRASGEAQRLELDGIFVQIGLKPNTEWLAGSLALSAHGEIVIDQRCATSLPGVFAAGDATTVPYKQIVVAMGEGSKAALSAFDYLIRQAPSEQAAA